MFSISLAKLFRQAAGDLPDSMMHGTTSGDVHLRRERMHNELKAAMIYAATAGASEIGEEALWRQRDDQMRLGAPACLDVFVGERGSAAPQLGGYSEMAENHEYIGMRNLSRRDVLEWLGKGAVLALGADLAAACAYAAAEPKGFSFQPGAGRGAIFAEWPVRTVDTQDLVSILARWRLEISGLVEEPRSYTFTEILALPRTDQAKDFHCVEGWSVDDVPWNGVTLSDILRRSRPAKKAAHINIRTVGGRYNDSLPLSVAMEPGAILAYGIAGSTLPLDHGFPLRVVVPRLLGYKNAKYVERLELADKPLIGYWVAAGYDLAGLVPQARLRKGHY